MKPADVWIHLLLQQFGGGHVSAALPSGTGEVRPGQDGTEDGRVLQSEIWLHEDLEIKNTDKQDIMRQPVINSCNLGNDTKLIWHHYVLVVTDNFPSQVVKRKFPLSFTPDVSPSDIYTPWEKLPTDNYQGK